MSERAAGPNGAGAQERTGPAQERPENPPNEHQRLVEALYAELRERAGHYMRGQPAGHTLQPTALVNEVYLKLSTSGDSTWNDRVHFLATASRAMRQVLVDHARCRAREKRTPPGTAVPLDQIVLGYEERAVDLMALDEALADLAGFDATMARAVELRFFGGLSQEETAGLLKIPQRSFERRWAAARAWLLARIT